MAGCRNGRASDPRWGLQLRQSLPPRPAGLQRRSATFCRDSARPFCALPFPCEPRVNAILTVENLFKQFPIAGSKQVVQAVNDVSFSIQPGETLGLVGESGSGKTTV